MVGKFTAVIAKGENWYVAHCVELWVVSQGKTAFFGVNRPASRSKSATLTDQAGHPHGANRPPPVSD